MGVSPKEIVIPSMIIGEYDLIAEAKRSARNMLDNLTLKEVKRTGIVPLVITEIAWTYADMARKAAAKYKLDMFVKMGRVYDSKRADYERWLAKDIDFNNRSRIKIEAERMLDDLKRDFTILYFCCNQELKRVAPEYNYEDIRTLAIVSIELCALVDSINKLNDIMLEKRIGEPQHTLLNPYTEWLWDNMMCYAGVDTKFYNYRDKDILRACTVIKNKAFERDYDILSPTP